MSDAVAAGVAVAGLAVGLVGLLLAVVALRRAASLRSVSRRFTGGGADDLLGVLDRQARDLDGLEARIAGLTRDAEQLRAAVGRSVSRVATIRYDAFADMGGQLSSSSALLDEGGSGLVLTSLNGRTESRTYAKHVVDGASTSRLSDEEADAVRCALDGTRALPGPGNGSRNGRVLRVRR